MIKTEKFQIGSRGFNDCIDLTRKISDSLINSGCGNCALHIFVPQACGIFILPKGTEILKDLCQILEDFIPINRQYQYDQKYNSTNAFAHLRSAMTGNSLTIPVVDGKIFIEGEVKGAQIIMIDFDNKAQLRTVVTQLTGLP